MIPDYKNTNKSQTPLVTWMSHYSAHQRMLAIGIKTEDEVLH